MERGLSAFVVCVVKEDLGVFPASQVIRGHVVIPPSPLHLIVLTSWPLKRHHVAQTLIRRPLPTPALLTTQIPPPSLSHPFPQYVG